MAVSATVPANATVYSTTAGDSYATGSWSGAGATRTYICFVEMSWAASADKRTITVSGNGLTWTQVDDNADWDPVSAGVRRAAMFRARGTATTGATTANAGAGNDCTGGIVVVVELDGVDGTTNEGVVQSVTTPSDAIGTTFTLTLSSFASGTNATLCFFVMDTNVAPTEEGGYTSLTSGTHNTPNTGARAAFLATADTSPSMTGSNINWAGMACEIAELVTAVPSPVIPRRNLEAVWAGIDPTGWA